MSKRKPALRIGGGFLNRNTLANDTDSLSSLENRTNGSVMSTTSTATHNDIDAEVANFLKEIDEVVATEPSSEVQTELPVKYGDWQQCIDEKTQHMYYWNIVTDEVTWILPEEISNHFARQSKESCNASVNSTTTTTEVEVDTLQEKKSDSNKSHVSSDSSPINTELDIDAELERAVEEKGGSSTCFKVEPLLEKTLRDSPTNEAKGDDESDLATSDACVQCDGLATENSSSPDKNSDTEEEATITEISQTLFGKLKFLGISNVTLTNFHFLLIQIETRISDWKEKALSTSFVLKKLQEADQQLKAYEESATPSGWSCHWDSSAARYFYMNDETQKMQWQYPETSGSENTKTGADDGNEDDSDDDMPPKKSRKENFEQSPPALPKGDSTPPLPAAPIEKPPLPPQPEKPEEVEGEGDSDSPDNDDGIMMEISDGEKEEDNEKLQSMAASAVTSQQPVLYKGPTINYNVSSPLNPQTYQSMLQQTMPSSQTTHTAISDARTVLAKTKRKKTKKSSSVAKKPSKGISSMVAQWQKAKHEIEQEDRMLEEEEDDNEEPDREELGRQHFEKWKKEQIASGRAFANANFEPVPEDWRTRMMQKKKKKKKKKV